MGQQSYIYKHMSFLSYTSIKVSMYTYEILYSFISNTLASHLCGRGSIPVMAVSGKAGSCLPLVGSLQYRTLANYMYWFPLPFQLPVMI